MPAPSSKAATVLLPVRIEPPGNDQVLTSFGFRFEALDPGNRRERAAVLPAGWSQRPGSVPSVTRLIDEQERPRIMVAEGGEGGASFMRLVPLALYVAECSRHARDVVTDPDWASVPAVELAASEHLERLIQAEDLWRLRIEKGHATELARRRIAAIAAQQQWCRGTLIKLEAVS